MGVEERAVEHEVQAQLVTSERDSAPTLAPSASVKLRQALAVWCHAVVRGASTTKLELRAKICGDKGRAAKRNLKSLLKAG